MQDTAYREAVRMEMRMDANILPDTRYKVVQKDSHAWEREEYASAGQHRQWRDNRSLHRNYQSYDRSRNNDRQGHYVGQIQPLMQNTSQLPVPVPTAQGAQSREQFQPSGRGYQDPGRLFQRDSRLFNPYDSRDDLAPATGGGAVNYTIQQRAPSQTRNFNYSRPQPQNFQNRPRSQNFPNSQFRQQNNTSNWRLNSNTTRPTGPNTSQPQPQGQQNMTPQTSQGPSRQPPNNRIMAISERSGDCLSSTMTTIRDLEI